MWYHIESSTYSPLRGARFVRHNGVKSGRLRAFHRSSRRYKSGKTQAGQNPSALA